MKKGRKKGLIFAAAAVILVAGGLKIHGMTQGGEEVLPMVETVAAEMGTVAQEVNASGIIVSDRKETYFSPVSGKITKADFQMGDTVEAGTSMVEFDVEDLSKALEKAQMNQDSGAADARTAVNKAREAVSKQEEAKVRVEELEKQIALQQDYLTKAKKQISSLNVQAQVDSRNAAYAQAVQAQAAQQAAAQQAAQIQQEALEVYQQQTLPEYEAELSMLEQAANETAVAYNQAASAYDMAFAVWQADQTAENAAALDQALQEKSTAQMAMEQAKGAYENLQASQPQMPSGDTSALASVGGDSIGGGTPIVDTTELEAQMEKVSTKLAELQSELAAQKAIAEADSAALSQEDQEKLEIAERLNEMDVESAKAMLEKADQGIQAEFTGVVSKSMAVGGAAVTEGMELFTLESLEEVSVDVNISKYDFDKVEAGQKAEITVGDYVYEGTVASVNRIASQNEKGIAVIGASVKIENPDDKIFIGVDAKVKIHAAQAENVLTLPSEVINIGKDGPFCYVLEDGLIARKPIVTGLSSDSLVEVTEGLEEGEEIITDMGTLMEGQPAVSAAEAADPEPEDSAGAGDGEEE